MPELLHAGARPARDGGRGLGSRPPQVAIQCANSLEYGELCKGIPCQAPSIGIDETCTPGPYDDVGVFGCDVYRYNTPFVNGAPAARPAWLVAAAAAAGLAYA